MSSAFCINIFIQEKNMAKTLSSLILENKQNVKDIHGTPYLIRHDRNNIVIENEEPQNPAWYHLTRYPNQNQNISGDAGDEHVYQTHMVLSSLHPKAEIGEDYRHVYEHTVASHPTNDALWNRHTSPEWSAGLPKNVTHLDRATNKFQVPSGGLTTFSGLQSDPSEAAAKHPENKLFLPSYTSTTINPTVTERFAKGLKPSPETEIRHIMKFRFPEGMNAGTYVSSMSHHPTEYEFLTRRGMSVRLHPEPEVIPYKPSSDATHGKMKIWTATPLGFHEK